MIFNVDEIIRELPSDAELFSEASWASTSPNHRQKMRLFLKNHLHGKISAEEAAALDDLNLVPSFRHVFSSSSHSAVAGVVVISSRPIGIDLEETQRIKIPVVQRIASQEEFRSAPSAAHLWCAKEAVFKSLLSEKQPAVLSDFSVNEWQIGSTMTSFELQDWQRWSSAPGRGFVFSNSSWTFALFQIQRGK